MQITKEEFEAYESVRASGVTNMFDTKTVTTHSGLEKNKIMEIMSHYGELRGKYNG